MNFDQVAVNGVSSNTSRAKLLLTKSQTDQEEKQMKSRTVAVLCALVLTAGALAGCGNSKASDTKEKTKTENTADDSEDEITVEEE